MSRLRAGRSRPRKIEPLHNYNANVTAAGHAPQVRDKPEKREAPDLARAALVAAVAATLAGLGSVESIPDDGRRFRGDGVWATWLLHFWRSVG